MKIILNTFKYILALFQKKNIHLQYDLKILYLDISPKRNSSRYALKFVCKNIYSSVVCISYIYIHTDIYKNHTMWYYTAVKVNETDDSYFMSSERSQSQKASPCAVAFLWSS